MRAPFPSIFLPHHLKRIEIKGAHVYCLRNQLNCHLGFGCHWHASEESMLRYGFEFFDNDLVDEVGSELHYRGYSPAWSPIPLYDAYAALIHPLQDPYYFRKLQVLSTVYSRSSFGLKNFEDIFLPHRLYLIGQACDAYRGYILLNRLGGFLGSSIPFNDKSFPYPTEMLFNCGLIQEYAVKLDCRGRRIQGEGDEIILWDAKKGVNLLRDLDYFKRLKCLEKVWKMGLNLDEQARE